LIRFGVLLVAGSEKGSSLSGSLLPLLVANKWSGYIRVLVWFRLGILVFILITLLCGIPDRLFSDFLGTPMMGDVGVGNGEPICFRLFSFFLSVCWLEKLKLNHGGFVVVIDLVMYMTYDRKNYCDRCYRNTCCACVCFLFSFFCNCIYIVSY
jgi:hypothetical protein